MKKHHIGLFGACTYVVGAIIGSGIFITPTDILKSTGSIGLSLVVWLVAGLMSLLGALTFTELGTSVRISGSSFAYICYVNWDGIAFLFLWTSFIVMEPCFLAIIAKTFSAYVVAAIPVQLSESAEMWEDTVVAWLVLWLLAFVNCYRVDRFAAGIQIISTIAKVAALCVIIALGLYKIGTGSTEHFERMFDNGTTDVGTIVVAINSGLWSYTGWYYYSLTFRRDYVISTMGKKAVNLIQDNFKFWNGRTMFSTVPVANIAGVTFVILIYVLTNVAYFAVLGAAGVLQSNAVAETFSQQLIPKFAAVIPVFVGLSTIGALNGTIFCGTRILFAGARKGQLPSSVGLLNQRQRTPIASIILCTVLSSILVPVAGIDYLINTTMVVEWIQVTFSVLALLWIRYKHLPVHPNAIKFPIALHVAFLLICIFLIVMPLYQQFKVSLTGIGITLTAVPVYFALIRPAPHWPWLLTIRQRLSEIDRHVTIFIQKLLVSLPDLPEEVQNAQEKQQTVGNYNSVSSEQPISDHSMGIGHASPSEINVMRL